MPGRRKPKQQTVAFTPGLKILSNKYDKVSKVTGSVVRNDFFELVQIPPGVPKSDWLISNAVDFLERTELLFSSCSLFCTVSTCPMFNAGPHYHYFWEDDDTQQPVQLSAPEYFNALKHWVKRTMANEKLFPRTPGADLSSEAFDALKTIYRRLFRIMAHMYMCHFSDIKKQNMETVINTVLGHYSVFALHYELIELSEIEMLEPVYVAMAKTEPTVPTSTPAT
jgi:MOB kinase activator 1